jgi:hypothetical protein
LVVLLGCEPPLVCGKRGGLPAAAFAAGSEDQIEQPLCFGVGLWAQVRREAFVDGEAAVFEV